MSTRNGMVISSFFFLLFLSASANPFLRRRKVVESSCEKHQLQRIIDADNAIPEIAKAAYHYLDEFVRELEGEAPNTEQLTDRSKPLKTV